MKCLSLIGPGVTFCKKNLTFFFQKQISWKSPVSVYNLDISGKTINFQEMTMAVLADFVKCTTSSHKIKQIFHIKAIYRLYYKTNTDILAGKYDVICT